ncbi:MAG: hypothetical protein ABIA74_01305 [bacterium]
MSLWNIWIFKKIISVLFFCFLLPSLCGQEYAIDFIKSFVKHYEFNAEGRYTHEYHPFILEKTATSLDELEESLTAQGFNLFGRIVICGYEEQAVPTYYTNYAKPKINDEAMFKHKVGWSLKLHNKFGFMTGFLFKDLDYFNDLWFEEQEPLFEHINSNKIEIFRDQADIFQEHAFGQAHKLITQCTLPILEKIKKQNCKGVFKELLIFWKNLYKNALQVNNKQVAGTADIFFSIEYAKHLIRSFMPFLKFFTGPDITYPIEVSLKQEKEATANAQDFVKRFSKQLIPRNNKPTVYIFCSFVDGVGKTTLLGNVKNRLIHGDDVESFERVDNSSSQLADMFKVKENVFVADLPAQISHFTYKPDGLVFVSAERELQEDKLESVKDFVRQNKDEFHQKYEKLKTEVEAEIKINGFFSQNLNAEQNVEKSFIKNLFLLKKDKTNLWIPFQIDGAIYLFKLTDLSQIRVLCALGEVQSEGLKNVEAEQMLFFDGVRFPLPYLNFLEDLIAKLKNAEIENIVFVDFISMYPRSSRENIRINYLLQQLALLYEEFDPQLSLYRNFVNDSELLFLLNKYDSKQKIIKSFEFETLVRLAMYKLIAQKQKEDIEGVGLCELTETLKKELDLLSNQDIDFTKDFISQKVKLECMNLENIYGLSKSFVNVQKLDFDYIYKFSEKLIEFFSDRNFIQNEHLIDLWDFPVADICGDSSVKADGIYNQSVNFNDGNQLNGLYLFNKFCRDENLLTPFIRNLRSSWYATISNLIFAQGEYEARVEIEKEKYFVPPFVVKKDQSDHFYLVRKYFEEYEGQIDKKEKKVGELFNLKLIQQSEWGQFDKQIYRLNWDSKATNCGIFGFDSDLESTKKLSNKKSIITFLIQRYQKQFGADIVITTSKLYEILKGSELWKRDQKTIVEQAKKNGPYKDRKKKPLPSAHPERSRREGDRDDKKKKKNSGGWGLWGNNDKKVYLVSQDQIGPLRLFVRFIATLEMVLKDPESNIVVRRGSKKDFKAAIKLLEHVVLPKYFGLLCEKKLFEDYNSVEPLIDFD